MPSALPSNPGLLGRMASVLGGKLGSKDNPQNAQDRVRRLGLSKRQQELNRLWAVYRGQQYAHCKLDWNGRENIDDLSGEIISTQGYVPPGFMDMGRGAGNLPLKFRRPTSPYALIRVVVDRFTGLLFSEQQHPEIKVDGDPKTQEWLRAVASTSRLWQHMIQARNYGGSMGTACIGFQFVNGKPTIEVHDPKWVTPEFRKHGSLTLVKLEKRYIFEKEVRDETTGRWENKSFWYRRIIDEQSDVLFQPAEVGNGDEPDWQEAERVDHNFGFCPAVWVQNLPVQDSEDGDPDCPSPVYDNAWNIDALISQANRAILANCDPQLVITTKAEMAEVQMALDKALRVPEGDAKFLEVQATGPKAALELSDQLRRNSLEVSHCVLEHPDVAGKTATEGERMYQAMFNKCDILREQYGQKGILPLLEMFHRAAVALNKPRPAHQDAATRLQGTFEQPPQAPPGTQNEGQPGGEAPPAQNAAPTAPQAGAVTDENDGMIMPQGALLVRSSVVLPPTYQLNPQTGQMEEIQRELGFGGTITLVWPEFVRPTLDDLTKAVTATTGALSANLIDDETAVGFVAPYFKVEDKSDLLNKIRNNAAQQQADMMSMFASSNQPKPSDVTAPPGPIIPPAPTE